MGTEAVAKAAADGTILLIMTNSFCYQSNSAFKLIVQPADKL